MKTNNSSALKTGFIAFIITYAFCIVVYAINVFNAYEKYFTNSNVSRSEFFSYIGISTIAVLQEILPLCVVIMTLFAFRKVLIVNKKQLFVTLKKTLHPVIILCCLSFAWVCFLGPELGHIQLIKLLEMTNLKSQNVLFYEAAVLTDELASKNIIELFQVKVGLQDNYVQFKIAQKIFYPFLIFALFYIGFFLSRFSQNIKMLIVILIGIYFVFYPYFIMQDLEFRALGIRYELSPYLTQMLFITILEVIAILLYILVLKQVKGLSKKEQENNDFIHLE